jgi:hypothetical protein
MSERILEYVHMIIWTGLNWLGPGINDGDESSGSVRVETERSSAFQVRPCIDHFILFIYIYIYPHI